jgi:hypothetical protein
VQTKREPHYRVCALHRRRLRVVPAHAGRRQAALAHGPTPRGPGRRARSGTRRAVHHMVPNRQDRTDASERFASR